MPCIVGSLVNASARPPLSVSVRPAMSGPRDGPFERPQQTVRRRSLTLAEMALSTRRGPSIPAPRLAPPQPPAHHRGMNRRDGEPSIGRSEINDQSTQTPGTATLRNRCGEATALDG
jgi:hypothetical protein